MCGGAGLNVRLLLVAQPRRRWLFQTMPRSIPPQCEFEGWAADKVIGI
jgi:hypothetical protein